MDYQRIVLARLDFDGRVQSLFADIDLLLVPSQAEAAATIARMTTVGTDPAQLAGLLRFTSPFDMTGNPTISLPGGFTADGNPVGFQLVGRKWAEATLFRAGHAYQQATAWHRQHPAVSPQ
jgi:amidase